MKKSIRKFFQDKKKRRIFFVSLAVVLALVLVLLLVRCGEEKQVTKPVGVPTLTVQTPQKLSRSTTDEFVLDVTISDLGDALYPAMSLNLRFDSSRLELVDVEEGNVFICDDETVTGQKLPDWSYNVERCNRTGVISVMYVDMTGGRYAFSKELLAEDDNVVLRLRFRLRGSARIGDVYDLIFEDAVFAASDETQSLAMTTGTLKTRDGKLVVGE